MFLSIFSQHSQNKNPVELLTLLVYLQNPYKLFCPEDKLLCRKMRFKGEPEIQEKFNIRFSNSRNCILVEEFCQSETLLRLGPGCQQDEKKICMTINRAVNCLFRSIQCCVVTQPHFFKKKKSLNTIFRTLPCPARGIGNLTLYGI